MADYDTRTTRTSYDDEGLRHLGKTIINRIEYHHPMVREQLDIHYSETDGISKDKSCL